MAGNERSVVIHLPDDSLSKTTRFGKEGLEELVKSMFGGQVGRDIDKVIVRSGSGGPSTAPRDWTKTVWSRAC